MRSELINAPAVNNAIELTVHRPYVAVATMDGLFVNLHLGESETLRIYRMNERGHELVDIRAMPVVDIKGIARWRQLATLLKDCSTLLVHGIGPAPRSILMNEGISVYVVEGFVDKIISMIRQGRDISFMDPGSDLHGMRCYSDDVTGCM